MQLFQEPEGNLFASEATLVALFIIIILVDIAARYFRLPYTTILVVAGAFACLGGGQSTSNVNCYDGGTPRDSTRSA